MRARFLARDPSYIDFWLAKVDSRPWYLGLLDLSPREAPHCCLMAWRHLFALLMLSFLVWRAYSALSLAAVKSDCSLRVASCSPAFSCSSLSFAALWR